MNPFGPLPDPQHLFSHDEAAQAFADILDARASEDEIQAFLIALSARGETMVEIAAAAQGRHAQHGEQEAAAPRRNEGSPQRKRREDKIEA